MPLLEPTTTIPAGRRVVDLIPTGGGGAEVVYNKQPITLPPSNGASLGGAQGTGITGMNQRPKVANGIPDPKAMPNGTRVPGTISPPGRPPINIPPGAASALNKALLPFAIADAVKQGIGVAQDIQNTLDGWRGAWGDAEAAARFRRGLKQRDRLPGGGLPDPQPTEPAPLPPGTPIGSVDPQGGVISWTITYTRNTVDDRGNGPFTSQGSIGGSSAAPITFGSRSGVNADGFPYTEFVVYNAATGQAIQGQSFAISQRYRGSFGQIITDTVSGINPQIYVNNQPSTPPQDYPPSAQQGAPLILIPAPTGEPILVPDGAPLIPAPLRPLLPARPSAPTQTPQKTPQEQESPSQVPFLPTYFPFPGSTPSDVPGEKDRAKPLPYYPSVPQRLPTAPTQQPLISPQGVPNISTPLKNPITQPETQRQRTTPGSQPGKINSPFYNPAPNSNPAPGTVKATPLVPNEFPNLDLKPLPDPGIRPKPGIQNPQNFQPNYPTPVGSGLVNNQGTSTTTTTTTTTQQTTYPQQKVTPQPVAQGNSCDPCQAQAERKLDEIYKKLGLDLLPASLPKTLLKYADGQQESIPTMLEVLGYQVRQMDAVFGQFPIVIEVQDADPTKPGNQSKKYELPNVSEAIAELFGLSLSAAANADAAVNLGIKQSVELVAAKNAILTTQDYAKANASFLGYRGNHVPRKVDYAINPVAKDSLEDFMQPGSAFIQGWREQDPETVVGYLQRIVFASGIIKAAFFRDRKAITRLQKEIDSMIESGKTNDDNAWKKFIEMLNEPDSDFNKGVNPKPDADGKVKDGS